MNRARERVEIEKARMLKSGSHILWVIFGFIAIGPVLVRAEEPITLQTFKSHSRLSLSVDDNVTKEIKATSRGFEIFFKGIAFADLGAPLGAEKQWKTKFEQLKDERIHGIQIKEETSGVKVSAKWIFPSGRAALADPKMEWFDYNDKGSSRYVLDFWVKKGRTLVEEREKRIREQRDAALRQAKLDAEKRVARKLASVKARSETEDTTKFCRQPLTEKTDVFLAFQPFHEQFDFNRWFSTTTPDAKFPYYKPKERNKDAQYVRLALQLYRDGKNALVLRTIDFFSQEALHSAYQLEMTFLKANALIKLGMEEEAEAILTKIMTEEKDSPAAIFSGMYLAHRRFEKKDYLAAHEQFSWLILNHPNHRLTWVFHLGAAESLFPLKQTEKAAREYQWVVENAPDRKSQSQGALRIGDLYLDRRNFDQASAAYSTGIKYFTDESKKFPTVYINRAEALYELGEYQQAREGYEKFLENFPSHPAGWRATFRLGEIYGRMDKEQPSSQSRKWFTETINHYPFSPGATLARLRLLPCGDHAGFNLKGAEKFLSEDAEKFDGQGEVFLMGYPDFRSLAKIRTMLTMNTPDRALAIAAEEIQKRPASRLKDFVNRSLSVLFRRSVVSLLDKGEVYPALKYYETNNSFMAQRGPQDENTTDADFDYLLRLSREASALGLGEIAQKIVEDYRKMSGRREIAASELEHDLDAQLKLSEQKFTEAKALWITVGMKEKQHVQDLLASVREESPFSFEREVILGLIEQREGNNAQALKHALRAQILQLDEESEGQKGDRDLLRVDGWVAGLQADSGDAQTALDLYRKIEKQLKTNAKKEASVSRDLGLPPSPTAEDVLIAEAKILEKQSQWGEAASTYGRAMEKGLGGNQAIYGHAHALINLGNSSAKKKGIAELEKLAQGAPTDFWRKLAVEKLADEQALEKK